MARQQYTIDESSIFDVPVVIPSGIDGGYKFRSTVPILVRSSGYAFVRAYQEFIFRMIENGNTYSAYHGNTVRFLNFAFYCLKVRKVSSISSMHVKKYIKYRTRGEKKTLDVSTFSPIKVLFEKFVHEGLLTDNPFPETDLIPELKRRKTQTIDAQLANAFIKTSENELYETIDHALNTAHIRSVLDYRAKALIASLLYTDLKIGQAISLQLDDFRKGSDGNNYIRIWKGNEPFLRKICDNAIVHFDAYVGAALFETEDDEPFFQQFNKSRNATGKAMSTGRARETINLFFGDHDIQKVNTHEITCARPLRTLKGPFT